MLSIEILKALRTLLGDIPIVNGALGPVGIVRDYSNNAIEVLLSYVALKGSKSNFVLYFIQDKWSEKTSEWVSALEEIHQNNEDYAIYKGVVGILPPEKAEEWLEVTEELFEE